ncbi:hypothetical protein [Azohydromonas australica]|uniref:hypothetical protein n=1 Tax=Azohydromonas australica TaxID=364039 RepID=UPI0003FD24A2|nr:hypothetical protein [Azohydromonas australica]
MTVKKTQELRIERSNEPIPTIEVDEDDIPEQLCGWEDLLGKALAHAARKWPDRVTTVYSHQRPSTNFGMQTCSVFFIVNDYALLDTVRDAFRNAGVRRVRGSDSLRPSWGTPQYHLEDGVAWRRADAITWESIDLPEDVAAAEDDAEDDGWDDDDVSLDVAPEEVEESEEAVAVRTGKPVRFRAARADASIGTIRRKIEEIFGLPEGSVAICGPDRRALRADATIRTLRRRWENAA